MPDVKKPLRSLALEFGVDLEGLTEDQFNELAIRFVMDGRLNSEVFAALVEDVRKEGRADMGKVGSSPSADRVEGGTVAAADDVPPSTPKRGMRFLATEATAAKMRARLARAHHAEDARSGLSVGPRTPDILPAHKPHPACLAAARDGGTPCMRCAWLLGDDPWAEFWMDRDD